MPTTKLHRFTIEYSDKEEFHHLRRDIFREDSYYFESENAQPVIVDLGAHIGLATVYFKHLFPGAIVHAYEPDPVAYQLLEKNVFENDLLDVMIHQVGVAVTAGENVLYRDPEQTWLSTSSVLQGSWQGDQRTEPSKATFVTLSSILYQLDADVDFLKMDIEGAELAVLKEARRELNRVHQIAIEFHPHAQQRLEQLVELLERAGFRVRFAKHGQEIPLEKAKGLVMVHGVRQA